MRRPLTAVRLAAAAVPAPAAAAGLGELPFHPSPGGASCVRTPGAPGEVARAADGSVELLRAACWAPGGSALVSWPSDAVTRGVEWVGVRVAGVPLAGGHVDVQRLGSPLRDLDSAAPLALGDGTPAVAWADDAGGRTRGRVHLDVAGAADAASRGVHSGFTRG